MTTEEDYVERLEKIIDKQDALLSQLDSKFKQQDSLNESLAKQNKYLKEDIQKHKNLTRDMNKTVAQHKNVVAKLKKELEGQLKIQQDLHKDYGEVIKNLTDDLEEEQNKNEELTKKQTELENEIKKLKDDLAKAKQTSNVSAGNSYYDSFNKTPTIDSKFDNSKTPKEGTKKCPNCGAEVLEGYLFCESCGTKL
jgi:DNA repair exonuclease SbcCD ATPase subunit